MKQKWAVKIVVASPGDVQPERDALEQTVSTLNWLLRHAGTPGFLELWRWETDTHPGLHPEGPQGLIDSLLRIEEADILIGIFWWRFGTPVHDAGSGTEHEIRKAIAGFKSKGSPQVMLYFNNSSYEPKTPSEVDQYNLLQSFKDEFKTELDAAGRPLIQDYTGDSEHYAKIVHNHLWILVQELLRKTPDIGTPLLKYSLEATPVVLRQEGITELLGDLHLRCRLDSQTAPRHDLWFSVLVAFTAQTQVTSRLLKKGLSVGEPILFEVGRTPSSAHVLGTIRGNWVIFPYVPLTDLKANETRIFQISNLRLNATAFDTRATGRASVIAYLSVTGAPVEGGNATVGVVRKGLDFEVMNANGDTQTGIYTFSQANGLPLQKIAVLRFSEAFKCAFKTRLDSSSRGHPCEDGYVYTSESYTGVVPAGLADTIRPADAGTCLKAVFGIPKGVNLYVPVQIQPHPGLAPRARIVEAESSLKSKESVVIGTTEFKELDQINPPELAVAVWEVIQNRQWNQPLGSVDLPIFASAEANAQLNLPNLGMAHVRGSFAPDLITANAAVPRFFGTSTLKSLFKVEL
jgi:hypothetical protein